jgi:ubiquinone/menaquinone biosynthesis C-methylase UbiE
MRHVFVDAHEKERAHMFRDQHRTAQAQRLRVGKTYGDVAQDEPHDKVSKALRAREFAAWLVATFGLAHLNSGEGVLDIAGGKGAVGCELWLTHRVRCTLVEPFHRKLSKSKRKSLRKVA